VVEEPADAAFGLVADGADVIHGFAGAQPCSGEQREVGGGRDAQDRGGPEGGSAGHDGAWAVAVEDPADGIPTSAAVVAGSDQPVSAVMRGARTGKA
jgi:hypothetical protein